MCAISIEIRSDEQGAPFLDHTRIGWDLLWRRFARIVVAKFFDALVQCFAIGCFANWLRNRTFHCAISGPLFLIGGVMFLLSEMNVIHVNTHWVWPFVLIGVGVAFLLESLYAHRSGA